VLAARVAAGTLDRALARDDLMLDRRHSWFVADELTNDLAERTARGELHPTGPLWGRGQLATRAEAQAAEEAALQGCEVWRRGLEQAGLEQDRRALRALARDLAWEWVPDGGLALAFTLAAGAYATALLREVVRGRE
jgi:tRNA pseudouridine13 synthase